MTKKPKEIQELKDIPIQIKGAARADLSSRTIDLKIPTDYYAKVKKAWTIYNIDSLIGMLVDRTVEFAINGMEWQVEDPKEAEIWKSWARKINRTVPNCMPGLDMVGTWIVKHLQVSGIAHMHWVWDSMELGDKKQKYDFPTMMVAENPLSVTISRTSEMDSEKILLKKAQNDKEQKKEGSQPAASPTMKKGDSGVVEVPAMGFGKKEEMFSIKWNYSHGDLTTIQSASTENTGQAMYPEPPVIKLTPQAAKRQMLEAADMAILDGVQNYLLVWSIGNKEHPAIPDKKDASGAVLKKGTVTMVKEILQGDGNFRVAEVFIPDYVKLDIKVPPMDVLLNIEKYAQPIIEIMNAFGIFVSVGGSNDRYLEINVANFEERVDNIRKRYVKRFLETLASYIVERNGFKSVPKLSFAPINTKSDNFISNLLEMLKLGKLSSQTMHEFNGIDHETETHRIKSEIESGLKDTMDQNTPVSFKQTVTDKTGKSDTTKMTPTKQTGRPKGT